MRVRSLLRGIHQRKPGLAAVAMGDDADWLVSLLVRQQNNHLAVALLLAMMRAWAKILVLAGSLQVKRADGLYAVLLQALDEPFHRPATGLCYLEKGRISIHPYALKIITDQSLETGVRFLSISATLWLFRLLISEWCIPR